MLTFVSTPPVSDQWLTSGAQTRQNTRRLALALFTAYHWYQNCVDSVAFKARIHSSIRVLSFYHFPVFAFAHWVFAVDFYKFSNSLVSSVFIDPTSVALHIHWLFRVMARGCSLCHHSNSSHGVTRFLLPYSDLESTICNQYPWFVIINL